MLSNCGYLSHPAENINYLTVLEAGSPRSGCWHDQFRWGLSSRLLQGCLLTVSSHGREGERASSLVSLLIRALIPSPEPCKYNRTFLFFSISDVCDCCCFATCSTASVNDDVSGLASSGMRWLFFSLLLDILVSFPLFSSPSLLLVQAARPVATPVLVPPPGARRRVRAGGLTRNCWRFPALGRVHPPRRSPPAQPRLRGPRAAEAGRAPPTQRRDPGLGRPGTRSRPPGRVQPQDGRRGQQTSPSSPRGPKVEPSSTCLRRGRSTGSVIGGTKTFFEELCIVWKDGRSSVDWSLWFAIELSKKLSSDITKDIECCPIPPWCQGQVPLHNVLQ